MAWPLNVCQTINNVTALVCNKNISIIICCYYNKETENVPFASPVYGKEGIVLISQREFFYIGTGSYCMI